MDSNNGDVEAMVQEDERATGKRLTLEDMGLPTEFASHRDKRQKKKKKKSKKKRTKFAYNRELMLGTGAITVAFPGGPTPRPQRAPTAPETETETETKAVNAGPQAEPPRIEFVDEVSSELYQDIPVASLTRRKQYQKMFEAWERRIRPLLSLALPQDGKVTDKAQQRAMYASRKRHLQFLQAARDVDVCLTAYDTRRPLTARLVGANAGQDLLVSDLATPLGVYPDAVIRSGDVISCSFETQLDVARFPVSLAGEMVESEQEEQEQEQAEEEKEEEESDDCSSESDSPEAATNTFQFENRDGVVDERHVPWNYWRKRYDLFYSFDAGVMIDPVGWYSVTPEAVARRCALRCESAVAIDAFAGVGGNTIQLAFTCERVIAIDLDPVRLACCKFNAHVYGVADRIEFILGDFLALAPRLCADVVFLSPPWGGPAYANSDEFLLEQMPVDGLKLFAAARSITKNVCYYLPRNTCVDQLLGVADEGEEVDMEAVVQGERTLLLTAYYGELAQFEEVE